MGRNGSAIENRQPWLFPIADDFTNFAANRIAPRPVDPKLDNSTKLRQANDVDDVRISLTGSTKAFVDAGLADGSYASVAECIDDLLLAGIKAKAQEKLEALLLEGLESGDDQPWTDEDWDELRSRIINR